MRKLASEASDSTLTSSSSMDKFSGSSSSFSHVTLGDVAERDETTCSDAILNSDQEDQPLIHEQPSLDLVSMDTAACWDCGSSLFDSFELVAMSKKLDADLHEPIIEGQVESVVDLEIDPNDHYQQNVLSLCDTPQTAISPPSSPPQAPHYEASDKYNIFDKLISAPDKQSKQAVYDMFCHYGDAAKHVTKQSYKQSSPADATCGGESRKHKIRPGRMSFHGLAKALHSITHLHLHTSTAGGGDSCRAEAGEDHHHHHHRHYSPLPQASMASKAFSTHGQGGHVGVTNPSVEHNNYDDVIEAGSQSKSRHIHHHHHHHYHYLFHSDDDFRLQPLDKSLMVAAAGLRSSKASPALSSYLESPARGDFPVDFGRKWGELGSIPSPNLQY